LQFFYYWNSVENWLPKFIIKNWLLQSFIYL
jgi:hypothetical protein